MLQCNVQCHNTKSTYAAVNLDDAKLQRHSVHFMCDETIINMNTNGTMRKPGSMITVRRKLCPGVAVMVVHQCFLSLQSFTSCRQGNCIQVPFVP